MHCMQLNITLQYKTMCSAHFGMNIVFCQSCTPFAHAQRESVSEILFIAHGNTLNHAHVLGLISLQYTVYTSGNYFDVRAWDRHWQFGTQARSTSVSSLLRFMKKCVLSTCCGVKPQWNHYCWRCDKLKSWMWIVTGVSRNSSAVTQCSTIDAAFGCRAILCVKTTYETPIVSKARWFPDSSWRSRHCWQKHTESPELGDEWNIHSGLFITVSQPVMHCSCPSFLLLIVTLVFWPSTPKPAAWVIPDFLWHSSELSRGLD